MSIYMYLYIYICIYTYIYIYMNDWYSSVVLRMYTHDWYTYISDITRIISCHIFACVKTYMRLIYIGHSTCLMSPIRVCNVVMSHICGVYVFHDSFIKSSFHMFACVKSDMTSCSCNWSCRCRCSCSCRCSCEHTLQGFQSLFLSCSELSNPVSLTHTHEKEREGERERGNVRAWRTEAHVRMYEMMHTLETHHLALLVLLQAVKSCIYIHVYKNIYMYVCISVYKHVYVYIYIFI